MKTLLPRIVPHGLPQRHSQPISTARILVSDVMLAVSNYYDVRLTDLPGSTRKRAVAWPRFMAMKLAYELTGLSYPNIGEHFGGRDHTSIMYGHRMATVWTRTSVEVAYDAAKLTEIAATYRDNRLRRMAARGFAPLECAA